MIIDTSVIVALMKREAEEDRLLHAIAGSVQRRISVASVLESHLVMARLRRGVEIDGLLRVLRIEMVAVTIEQMQFARAAYDKFSVGKYGLNFGDCLVYGLTKATGQPLLFKGNDFALTDVEAVPY